MEDHGQPQQPRRAGRAAQQEGGGRPPQPARTSRDKPCRLVGRVLEPSRQRGLGGLGTSGGGKAAASRVATRLQPPAAPRLPPGSTWSRDGAGTRPSRRRQAGPLDTSDAMAADPARLLPPGPGEPPGWKCARPCPDQQERCHATQWPFRRTCVPLSLHLPAPGRVHGSQRRACVEAGGAGSGPMRPWPSPTGLAGPPCCPGQAWGKAAPPRQPGQRAPSGGRVSHHQAWTPASRCGLRVWRTAGNRPGPHAA